MTPILLGQLYVNMRRRYFPKYTNVKFNPNDFRELATFLERENVNPEKYLAYVFGLCDYQRPLIPKTLADPILILKFRQTVRH